MPSGLFIAESRSHRSSSSSHALTKTMITPTPPRNQTSAGESQLKGPEVCREGLPVGARRRYLKFTKEGAEGIQLRTR
ncbi:hypothetical protein CgunFtcFv8_009960 [Champsocephalus gunnari]|uniref:Uncharacterized protein n=1 Tax=Champsocephalus gunnari TaxID=52237 RepID=A0AAN8C3C9_CHAGU|nr:hypothetical protein CgunFtcFv8_009960 [Champsocephalus gunnari]